MRVPLFLIAIPLGLAAGVGVAHFTTQPPAPEASPKAHQEKPITKEGAVSGKDATQAEFVRLNNQFVVPVLRDGAVTALVILSLTIEAKPGSREEVFAQEPKLRDALLSTLFDHANAGGFSGVFTETQTLGSLRRSLGETARAVLPEIAKGVLIMDLVRQDVS